MAKSGSDDGRPSRALTDGQRAYETRRAEEAGLSLEAWMARKSRAAAAAAAAAPASRPAATKAGKGLFARLLDRAHKPI